MRSFSFPSCYHRPAAIATANCTSAHFVDFVPEGTAFVSYPPPAMAGGSGRPFRGWACHGLAHSIEIAM
eukprot:11162861-Lingulodinium_polyedra.AAC.1